MAIEVWLDVVKKNRFVLGDGCGDYGEMVRYLLLSAGLR